jgi:hypothetical protein
VDRSPPDSWLENLRRGVEFERRVVHAWRQARLWQSGSQALVRTGGRKGYIDLWDDADRHARHLRIEGLPLVVDGRDGRAAEHRAHRNQLFRYLIADGIQDDLALVIIYSRHPSPEVAEMVEKYFDDWSVMVLW